MHVQRIITGAFQENCYLLETSDTGAILVDPGADFDLIDKALRNCGRTPRAVLLTHGHFDHICALPDLLRAYPELPVYLHAGDAGWAFSPENAYPPYTAVETPPARLHTEITDGMILSLDDVFIEVLHTPGHSMGCVCYRLSADPKDRTPPLLFSGDTLFEGSIGRTDFPCSNARAMSQSLRRLCGEITPETLLLPGHGSTSVMEYECAHNPFL